MRDFMKKAMRQHKNTLYLPSMWAMMEEIDKILWLWDHFDTLWRNSYPPPAKNQEELGLILAEIHKTRQNCKTLYRHCELDINSWSALQDLPLENLVIRQKGNTLDKEDSNKQKDTAKERRAK